MSVTHACDLLLKSSAGRKSSQRTCLVTRQEGDRRFMIRFVCDPEGRIVPDLAGKLPGRGLWIAASREAMASPKLRQAFSRGAKASVSCFTQGDDLSFADMVEQGLRRRVTEGIGLARKSGSAVTGFQKCREKLQAGKAGLILCAEDASGEEVKRLRSGAAEIPVCALGKEILEEAFGRENAVYAVISKGPLAERILADAMRFIGIKKGQADALLEE